MEPITSKKRNKRMLSVIDTNRILAVIQNQDSGTN